MTSLEDISKRFFSQAYGPATREGPVDGDVRHEAGVVMHWAEEQGIGLQVAAEILENVGVGRAEDLLRDYSGFKENLDQRRRPGDP